MRISDWSSDVCSSDLLLSPTAPADIITYVVDVDFYSGDDCFATEVFTIDASTPNGAQHRALDLSLDSIYNDPRVRSEEHTSELQSLMRISYAVFCLKKKKNKK